MKKIDEMLSIFFLLFFLNVWFEANSYAKSIFWTENFPKYTANSPHQSAILFLRDNQHLLNCGEVDALEIADTQNVKNISYIRFQQFYQGVKIKNAQAVVTVEASGKIFQLSDSTIKVDKIQHTGYCISDEKAVELTSKIDKSYIIQKTGGPIYIFFNKDGADLKLVKPVRVFVPQPFGIWNFYLECQSGKIHGYERLIVNADGYVYDPNPVATPAVIRVTLENLTSSSHLTGTLANAWACSNSSCRSIIRRATPDTDGNYLYMPEEPSIEDPFSEVNGYYHVNKINSWFETNLDFTSPCRGSRSMMIVVNMSYPNAFFGDLDGDGCGDVVLGQDTSAGGVDFAYDGDVIYHEYGHSVVEATAGLRGFSVDELGPDFSPGGLNEGTADYWSATITDDPTIGEYAGRGFSGELGIRSIDNSKTCPRDLTGESHIDGEIWSGTLWEIRSGIGASKTDYLLLAVLESITPIADFSEAGNALITQAVALESSSVLDPGDSTIVESIANARGLPGCERIIFLNDGESGSTIIFGLNDIGGWVSELASGVQFAIHAPDDAARIYARFTPVSMGSIDYDVYIKENSPVLFRISGYNLVVDDYDYVITGSPTSTAWTDWSTPPITPGTTYYMTFISRCPQTVVIGVRATIITSPRPDPAPEPSIEPFAEIAPDASTDTVEEVELTEAIAQDASDSDVSTDSSTNEVFAEPEPDAQEEEIDEMKNAETGKGCGCNIVR